MQRLIIFFKDNFIPLLQKVSSHYTKHEELIFKQRLKCTYGESFVVRPLPNKNFAALVLVNYFLRC